MLNSVILDVAIGLVFMFCLISLGASTLREAIEGVLKTRAVMLERGIRELVGDATDRDEIMSRSAGPHKAVLTRAVASSITKALYDHPQIYALFAGSYPRILTRPIFWWRPADRIGLCSNLPSYIPSRNFAIALLDYVARGSIDAPPGAGPLDTTPMDMKMIRAGLSRLSNVRTQRGLLSALDGATDLEAARRAVGDWYDSGMDRVSGWYRRETQAILLIIGFLLAVALNVDAIAIGQRLLVDSAWRDSLVTDATALQKGQAAVTKTSPAPPSAAPNAAKAPAPLSGAAVLASVTQGKVPAASQGHLVASLEAALRDNGFMIGAPLPPHEPNLRGWASAAAQGLPGYLAVALAATLGAPFWFDLLNKLIVVRSTVKPHEKSREEGSKDGLDDPPGKDDDAEGGDSKGDDDPPGADAAPPPALVGAGPNDDDDDIAGLDPSQRPREGNEA